MCAGFSRNADVNFKRIYIEKAFSVKLHSCEDGVVENKLHNIAVFAVYLVFKHLFRKEYQADRCAGFGVSRIGRQVVVNCEGFALNGRAYAARYVHFSVDDVFPQAAASCKKLFVLCFGGEVSHSRVKIYCADSVPNSFGLFTDRLCTLSVIIVPRVAVPNAPTALFRFSRPKVGSFSSLVDKFFGKFKKMLVFGKTV